MLESQRLALARRIRRVLKSGQSILVVGWMNQNHNDFTRNISSKKVLFVETKNVGLGGSYGLVLVTKFVKHAHSNQLCSLHADKVHKIPIGIYELRKLLKEQEPHLTIEQKSTSKPDPVIEPSANLEDDEVLEFLTEPRRHAMDDFDKFTLAFMEKFEQSGIKKKVSSQELSAILKKINVSKTPKQLVNSGWLIGVVKEGATKIGGYEPGKAMLERQIDEHLEPEGPYERALMLIQEEPELEAQLAVISAKLERIKVAKRVIGELGEF